MVIRLVVWANLLFALYACTPDITDAAAWTDARQKEYEQVLSACPDAEKSEKAFQKLGLLSEHGPILPSPGQRNALKKFVEKGEYRYWCHDQFRDLDLRMTGPVAPVASRIRPDASPRTTAFTTHSRVRIYYSSAMLRWLAGDRLGPLPDGAVMVKEMHPSKVGADASQVDGHAVMVKDSRSTRDGWLWYLHYARGNSAYSLPFEGAQYGNNFCLSCHAAAVSESTFADWGNLVERDVPTYITLHAGDDEPPPDFGTTHGRISAEYFALDSVNGQPADLAANGVLDDWNPAACAYRVFEAQSQEYLFGCVMYAPLTLPHFLRLNTGFEQWFGRVLKNPAKAGRHTPRHLPMDLLHDHLPPPPEGNDWLSASTCYACHDAADLLNGTNAEMSVSLGNQRPDFDYLWPLQECWDFGKCQDSAPDKLALAQFAEWTGSLMSVSSRDPVFRAQLESETVLYPDQAGKTTRLCLRCHAPAGERFDGDLAQDLANTYQDADGSSLHAAKFGALARDGVSCAVCHRIADEHLGEPASFTARFTLDDPDVVNGPRYDNGDLQTDPMETAIGVTPRFARHIEHAGLCGTCHMVDTPIYERPGTSAHEQTTYLEWRNSAFADETGAEYQTCQGCHMPATQPLSPAPTAGAIVNYEDSDFPYVANRKAAHLVDTLQRPGYRRHTLVGINVFSMGFFQQFPYLLGSHTFSPARQFAEIVPPRSLAMYEALQLARHETVDLKVSRADHATGGVTLDVSVTNKVGHKFPTGVGFRRAFLQVEALDDQGQRLWCSGCTSGIGVITDSAGQMLPAETAIDSSQVQPDYDYIDSDQQVQIYESRHINTRGLLTTSFVELYQEVKDNRLLPQGWRHGGFPDYHMEPVAASPTDEPAVDRVRYRLPSDLRGLSRVRVALYYQALPPYYLLDRIRLLAGKRDAAPETQRLLHLLLRMRIGDPGTHGSRAIENWRLQVGPEVMLDVR